MNHLICIYTAVNSDHFYFGPFNVNQGLFCLLMYSVYIFCLLMYSVCICFLFTYCLLMYSVCLCILFAYVFCLCILFAYVFCLCILFAYVFCLLMFLFIYSVCLCILVMYSVCLCILFMYSVCLCILFMYSVCLCILFAYVSVYIFCLLMYSGYVFCLLMYSVCLYVCLYILFAYVFCLLMFLFIYSVCLCIPVSQPMALQQTQSFFSPGLVLTRFCKHMTGTDVFLCICPGASPPIAVERASFSLGASLGGRMIGNVFDLCSSLLPLKIEKKFGLCKLRCVYFPLFIQIGKVTLSPFIFD